MLFVSNHRREVGGVDRWREVYPGIRTSLDVTRGSGQAASHRREVGGVDSWREVYSGIRTSLDVTRGSGQAASHRREVGGVDRWREVYPGIRTSLDVTRGSGQTERATDARSVGTLLHSSPPTLCPVEAMFEPYSTAPRRPCVPCFGGSHVPGLSPPARDLVSVENHV